MESTRPVSFDDGEMPIRGRHARHRRAVDADVAVLDRSCILVGSFHVVPSPDCESTGCATKPYRLRASSRLYTSRAGILPDREVGSEGFDFPICSGPEKIHHAEGATC